MDSEKEKEILETCEKIAAYYINSIIQLKYPEIDDVLSDYPSNILQNSLFLPLKIQEKASSTKTNKSSNNKGKKLPRKKKKKLEVDKLNNSVSIRESKRLRNFSVTYNVEENLKKLFEEQSEPEDTVNIKHPVIKIKSLQSEIDCKNALTESLSISAIQKLSSESSEVKVNNVNGQKLQNFQTFGIEKHEKKKPRIRTLSETSSDDEEVSNYAQSLHERRESQENLSDKSLDYLKMPQTSNAINKQLNLSPKSSDSIKKLQTSKSIDKQHQLPKLVFQKPQKVKECQGLKSIFQESTSFDDAMQKYAEKKKELEKIAPPKKIPTPEHDSSVKKVLKKKPNEDKGTSVESNSNKHLGGIFTINNGWDKKEINVENEIEKRNFNKLKRQVTPPNIVVDTNMEDVIAAHDEFMYNENLIDSLLVYKDSETSISTASSNSMQIAYSGYKLPENNSINVSKINSSLNSSDEDSENEDVVKAPSKKIRKLSYSDDEHPNEAEISSNEEGNLNKNDNGVVSLFAEAGEFDDLEEEQFYTDVDPDELKLNVHYVKRKIDPLDHQSEFDMNTKQISQHMVDPETDKILKTFFGNVCPAFLENRCSMPNCQRNHFLPEESRIHSLLIDATFDVIHKIFQIILKYHRLFQAYISILVEICVKNKDETGLVELVKACDRIPRTIVCYKEIARKLVELDYMKEHKAISFIIAHHTDNEIARETILSLILDSGPCITFFMDYIEKAHIKQPIRSDMFSRILHTCVAYQNPKLPNFCVNYLQGLSAHQMKNLNSEHLKAFLQMNRCISELNENREAKALRITQKLLSVMDW